MRAFPTVLCMTLLCTTLALGIPLSAQTPAPTPQLQRHSPDPHPTITTGTQLVVVDVVVQDRDNHPIRGLKQSDFQILESKKPQTTKSFEEHTTADLSAAKIPPSPKFPPGTFTDFTPVPVDSTLNVLLLDTLNTPMKDQAYVRYQLQQYVKKAAPGTRIAIFGLTSRLIFLQGFNSDPQILKDAVEHRLIPRASALLDDPVGSNTDPNLMSDMADAAGASASVVSSMQQFEAQTATFQTELRIRYTLDAFNALGRYLATFPGRKNIIWFSAAFPLTIFPDASLDDPFAVMSDATDELKETTSLLNRARVAVYPIDARGLQTIPVMDASRSGAQYARNPGRLASDISKFGQQNAEEHMAMDQIADDTGGHAFYNTNGLAEAVTKSIEAGANYYTLTYSPANRDWKGEYRKIDVKLQGDFASRNLKLSYRHGYYADDPNAPKTSSSSSVLTSIPATPAIGSVAYGQAAMERGAPTPSEILFKVRVLPHSKTLEDAVAPDNQPNPHAPAKGPFRRFDIDFAALTGDFAIPAEADGRRHGHLEFVAYVYDTDGKLLNVTGDTLTLNLTPENYARLARSGIGFHLEISTPAKSESFLRLAVHDINSGRMGVVEIPATSVARLPPPEPPPAAPTPTPAPAPITPSPK